MPELPEMETYRRNLLRYCQGQVIDRTEIGREKSINVPPGVFQQELKGATITSVDRVGKHLVIHLSTGAHLMGHLMLGGAIFYGTEAETPTRTFQVIMRFGNGKALYWYGLRLGWLHLVTTAELTARSAELGLDPLDEAFTAPYLGELLHGRRGALKPLLVDQQLFPGIGNCYADEICWAAQVHPLRVAGSLSTYEQARLWSAMKAVLTEATHLGGYTETPFHRGDTFTGGYLPRLEVYDRKGEPCHRCGSRIAFEHATGRKLFYCPACQPEAAGTAGAGATYPALQPEDLVQQPTGTDGV
jgi:formamidopyrimidine-DNA glycosylase